MSWEFRSKKYDVSKNTHNNFDFLMVEENIYRIRTAINQPLTGRDRRREEDVWITDCGVWTETAKCEERTCREESVK
jgi:hypothetical protein